MHTLCVLKCTEGTDPLQANCNTTTRVCSESEFNMCQIDRGACACRMLRGLRNLQCPGKLALKNPSCAAHLICCAAHLNSHLESQEEMGNTTDRFIRGFPPIAIGEQTLRRPLESVGCMSSQTPIQSSLACLLEEPRSRWIVLFTSI